MTMVKERLENCFIGVFPNLEPDEIESASVMSMKEWDSIATVTLLAVIEEEFGFKVPVEKLKQLDSFTSLLKYVGDPEFCQLD